jgi:glycosyltransferase involved in cell wall biosynthesis
MIAAAERVGRTGDPRSASCVHWQILTGEYPPQPGGVSDYTHIVASALAAGGDRVDVWAPPCAITAEIDPGVTVRRLPDCYGPRSLRLIDRQLDAGDGPRRLLVQYVPHAFGWKAANVPFCWWLRSRRRDSVWVMFHEVAYPTGSEYSARENALGTVTRWMASIVGRAAQRIFVSIPAWRPIVESLTGTCVPIEWLPVPSTISPVDDPVGSSILRARISQDRSLVGHLGTYGNLMRPLLEASLPGLLTTTDCRLLLLGRQGGVLRDALLAAHPHFTDRIAAPGALTDADLSRHVAACDVMLQPYPDGVSSRRTSVMVALSHSRPVVTTMGWLSEPFWPESGAVVTVPVGDPAALVSATSQLVSDRRRLSDLSARSHAIYAERFALAHTIQRLQQELPRTEIAK